jgi:RES domain-containing protein
VIVTAWRITKRKHARNAFSGEGAREFGGRWNNPGTAVVYTAQYQSLAALEMLVHLDSSELLQKYVLVAVEFDDSLITRVESSALPRQWRSEPSLPEVRSTGDEWVLSGTSAVLQVPSALVPGESNFLLNPGHKDFAGLSFGKPLSFRFDPRLAE